MVVQGRHFKDALAAHLKRGNLDHDRESFRYEDAADENQQQFLFDDDGYGSDSAAESERTDISHEHLGRMRVIPEKAETGAYHRATEDREFSSLPDGRDVEIIRKSRVAGDVGQRRQRGRCNERAADRKTVQTIGQIHGVG